MLEANDQATLVAALYGDEAAWSLGHRCFGLSARAGFAVAIADAAESGILPEAALSGAP